MNSKELASILYRISLDTKDTAHHGSVVTREMLKNGNPNKLLGMKGATFSAQAVYYLISHFVEDSRKNPLDHPI
jgi:hypothetical protein